MTLLCHDTELLPDELWHDDQISTLITLSHASWLSPIPLTLSAWHPFKI
jgi:hypothetical protein